MALRSAEIAIAELEKDILRMGRPARLFYSCTGAGRMRSHNLEQFLLLKRNVGLLWPEEHKPSVHPVEVMINLAINWNMNFLFDVRGLPNTTDAPPALLMTTGRLGVSWRYRYQTDPMSPEQYRDYVNRTNEALGVDTEQWDHRELQRLERSIVEAKIQIIQSDHHQEWFPLGSLDAFVPSAKEGFWIEILNKHFKGDINWTSDQFFVLQDVRILETVSRLLTAHGPEELHVGLSWIFIQSHLWAVLGMPKLMFPENTEKMKKYGCLEYVDSYFGLLSVREHIARRYREPDVKDFLESINRTIIAMLDSLALASNDVGAEVAIRKIAAMKINVLPAAEFFSDQELEKLYRSFPRLTNTIFVANLISLSRLHRRLLFDKNYPNVYGRRMVSNYGQSIYVYPRNYLEIPLLTLEPPMYYTRAAFAINYAGLGATTARDMIRAFDSRGVAVGEAGSSDQWWGASLSASYKRWLECSGSVLPGDVNRSEAADTSERLIMSVPALEVAFGAYRSAASRDTVELGSVMLGDLVDYTPDQIFFITYCHMLCALGNGTFDGDEDECTYAAKNFEPFAEAFACPVDSPMNPPRKCPFFLPSQQ
ncbi:hypothetical protein V5799_007287 [Amblyomma americanum]|uniref:M13 family peptidase n=1 Tax=Amblyomma americanum TaxID=6943 RepID=A0AAQ4DTZ9_AMBAM